MRSKLLMLLAILVLACSGTVFAQGKGKDMAPGHETAAKASAKHGKAHKKHAKKHGAMKGKKKGQTGTKPAKAPGK